MRSPKLQRLTEERFRQEWITFKGDDQKRWADFFLLQLMKDTMN
jgi:hypothetical protein